MVFNLLHTALNIFIMAMVGRLVLDYVRIFASSWRPRGIVLAIAEFVYAVTDPIVNFVRRFVPPLRLGPVALDLSFIVIFFGAQILSSILSTIARSF
ncbi:MAG: YggT family protein [Candidatus Nanopelagicaceae bacterium]